MKKTVIFAFQGNPLCFIHVLLNALNMEEQGMEGNIILEGEAVNLVPKMAKSDHFLHSLYTKAKEKGLIFGACRVCSHKMGVTEAMTSENIGLIGDMAGHPAMADYIKQGYTVITL
ncbi:MAG: cytoplasmic protein [Candidatus Electrothrix sp. AW2]|nr:cytoplasmic protein [Candidatus Electrothrix sp. AX1]MCI5118826.1 cytoplasmic protein [Candidatus Electrothrix gigas]MCI5129227.1 cytoplasmic protein [Candidatus Electrothrix gigas]MCI5133726.1 cytoplasmic protein [Candidatus Electrothrix gigas]MCI5180018.1 cytoplasmic protein [Candidatus Electrothrix gigas]